MRPDPRSAPDGGGGVAKVLQMVALSTRVPTDAAFARQLRRKLLA